MKKYLLITAVAVLSLLCFSSPWHIVVPILLAFCAYIIYELDHAMEMPDEE
jgi:hypothetical protein